MSRLFNDAALDQVYTAALGVVNDEPISMACWFYPDDDTIVGTMISVGDSIQTDFWRLGYSGTAAGDPVFCQKQGSVGTVSGAATTTAGTTINTWAHASCTFAANNSRSIYLNGANKITDTTSVNDFSADTTSIGVRYNSGVPRHFSGRLAECAIWAAALDDAEHAALGRGYSPLCIRPQSLRLYVPLVRNIYDARGVALTTSGTAVADHPRVFYPKSRVSPAFAIPSAASVVPQVVHHMRQQGMA